MKQYLIALTLMFALNAGAAGVQPRHRHHPQTEKAESTVRDEQQMISDTTVHDELEAFSDTTAAKLAGEEDTVYTSGTTITFDDSDDLESWVGKTLMKLVGGTIGIGGVIIAILIILAVLLCILAPFILVALVIRYLINGHNNRVALAEKAMETGQPIPDEMKPVARESPDFYKKRGIKNIAIGIGLTAMFGVWGADILMGVGILIACLGVGQLVIAKTSK